MKIYQIDAFTDAVFSGNYAAVVPLENWLSDDLLLKIARENNYPETAFFIKDKTDATKAAGNSWYLRWFTPTTEVDLCGHATLAAAYVIFQHLGFEGEVVVFNSQSGQLTVQRNSDGFFTMNFPSRPAAPIETPAALIEALGIAPLHTFMERDMLAVFDSEATVRALQPNFAQLMALEGQGVTATAPSDDPNFDFVSRYFAPKVGVDEDPVTGSTHCTLIPHWAAHFQKNKLTARQVSERGGTLKCELLGERVNISGQAVTYLIGDIYIGE